MGPRRSGCSGALLPSHGDDSRAVAPQTSAVAGSRLRCRDRRLDGRLKGEGACLWPNHGACESEQETARLRRPAYLDPTPDLAQRRCARCHVARAVRGGGRVGVNAADGAGPRVTPRGFLAGPCAARNLDLDAIRSRRTAGARGPRAVSGARSTLPGPTNANVVRGLRRPLPGGGDASTNDVGEHT